MKLGLMMSMSDDRRKGRDGLGKRNKTNGWKEGDRKNKLRDEK